MSNRNLYAHHLSQVSRSFSFCIARLEMPLRQQVGLAYLLLRILDTIEDARWPDQQAQPLAFLQFNQFVLEPPAADDFARWLRTFPSELPISERELLGDAQELFRDLSLAPPPVRKQIQQAVLNMSRGMQHFQTHFRVIEGVPRAELHLQNLSQLNGYCFFVAGVVGELLTDLLKLQNLEFEASEKVYGQAIQFGLFLQKINILKDQRQDENEGRKLVFSRAKVFASLRHDVAGAFQYLCSLPQSEIGFRLFCGWSLFLGLESLQWIEKAWALKLFEKIPRVLTQKLLTEIETIILDDEALQEKFTALAAQIPWSDETTVSAPWISKNNFESLYSGGLSLQQLRGAGVL